MEKMKGTMDDYTGEKYCSFKRGEQYSDHIFTLWQLSERYVDKGKNLHIVLMDQEKTCNDVERDVLLRVLKICEKEK